LDVFDDRLEGLRERRDLLPIFKAANAATLFGEGATLDVQHGGGIFERRRFDRQHFLQFLTSDAWPVSVFPHEDSWRAGGVIVRWVDLRHLRTALAANSSASGRTAPAKRQAQ